jgi:hypothetical protein
MATDVSEVAGAVEGLQIDGPTREKDEMEQQLSDQTGLDVEISGPGGTTGAAAVAHVVDAAVLDHSVASEQLFDASQFSTVPTMDGQATDTLDVGFGGKVSYESTSAEGRAMFDKLPLGGTFELRVAGRVVKKSGAWKEKADETEVVTGAVALKIDTIYVLSPEDL